jgi:restriction endonuclease
MINNWQRYERTAAIILNEVAAHFGLNRVEGKQSIHGFRSGVDWAIDAKGWTEGAETFVIIECRRYTTSKVKQEHIGALAYRISDTGAVGGIMVSPLGLQEGAERIAKAEKVTSMKLSADATPEEFAIEFLGNAIVRPRGVQMRAEAGRVTVIVTPAQQVSQQS